MYLNKYSNIQIFNYYKNKTFSLQSIQLHQKLTLSYSKVNKIKEKTISKLYIRTVLDITLGTWALGHSSEAFVKCSTTYFMTSFVQDLLCPLVNPVRISLMFLEEHS